jgi:hypothetical protein
MRGAATAGVVATLAACALIAPPPPSAELDLENAIPPVPAGIGGAALEAAFADMERVLGAEVTARDPVVVRVEGITLSVAGDPVRRVALLVETEEPGALAPTVEPLLPYIRRLTGVPQERLDEAMTLVEDWDGSEDLVHDERDAGYRVFAWARGPVPTLNLRVQGAD